MSSNSDPYPQVRKRAEEGSNPPTSLPISERARVLRVLNYRPAPLQPLGPDDYREPPFLEESDGGDVIRVDWDWEGNTGEWLDRHTPADPQAFYDPNEMFKTPPNEDDSMGYLELNSEGEYVRTGEGSEGSSSLRPPQENDLPSRNLSSASSRSLAGALRASMVGRGRDSTRNEGNLGAIREDLEPPWVQRRLSQDIPVATRGNWRFVLGGSSDESSSENAREPPWIFEDESPLLGSQMSTAEVQYIHGLQTANPPRFQLSSHQGQAGEERARRLHFYNGTESQGSGYISSVGRDEGLRAAFMPNFPQNLQQKLEEHFVRVRKAMEPWFRRKITWFAGMAMCIPILLILRGLMMGYPLMVGIWLGSLGREASCPFRVFLGSRVFNIL